MKLHSLVFAAVVLAAGPASSEATAAGITLAGFELYPTDGSGNTVNPGYYFSNNSSVPWSKQTLTQTSPAGGTQSAAPAFTLATGVNDFTFTSLDGYAATNTSHFGIGLYFTGDGTSFNPTTGIAPPELSGFASFGSGSTYLGNPVNGTSVADYVGPSENGTTYGGAHSYTVGTQQIYITELSANGVGGTLQLFVTPEPSSVILGSLGAVGLFIAARRRRA